MTLCPDVDERIFLVFMIPMNYKGDVIILHLINVVNLTY
jgi:hypothetical protein